MGQAAVRGGLVRRLGRLAGHAREGGAGAAWAMAPQRKPLAADVSAWAPGPARRVRAKVITAPGHVLLGIAASRSGHLCLRLGAELVYLACTMGVTKFNAKARTKFLKHFRQYGLLHLAAAAAGVTTETVRNHRKDDPDFDELYEETLEQYRDDLEMAAHARAVEGVEQDKYFKGEYTHTEVQYSDRLLELMLKRHRPEYRDKIDVAATVKGGIAVLPEPNLTSEEWERDGKGK